MKSRVRIIELAPSPEERAANERTRSSESLARVARGAWLIPPIVLSAIVATFALLRRGPDQMFGVAIGVLFGLAFLWVGISVLWPSRANRSCPHCKQDTLQRLDPRTTRGLVCSSCSWRDTNASSWYLAEEEGPLEEMILRDRGREVRSGGER